MATPPVSTRPSWTLKNFSGRRVNKSSLPPRSPCSSDCRRVGLVVPRGFESLRCPCLHPGNAHLCVSPAAPAQPRPSIKGAGPREDHTRRLPGPQLPRSPRPALLSAAAQPAGLGQLPRGQNVTRNSVSLSGLARMSPSCRETGLSMPRTCS